MKNNKYIFTFGVEIHAELLTNTKAFSPSKVDFGAKPNTSIHPIDLGYPGSKPTVNKKMVEYAYRLSKILEMDISDKLWFDRKNYFYPDLPKGFQITQYYRPIGVNGKFSIITNDNEKDITITEIHMEEDTAKQTKIKEGILFDFNRSGIPLIEIVSGHEELSSVEDVVEYVRQLKDQLVIMGINDGKMEEGSFRVDVNVSVRKTNQKEYGTRTEVKNLNSFKNIKKALEFEIKRHINILEAGKEVESYTVRFDEESNETIQMRPKDSENDYNFIHEGNITPITLSKKDIEEFNSFNDIKLISFKNKWKNKISDSDLSIITSSKRIFDLFNSLILKNDFKEVVNLLINNFKPMINEANLSVIRIDENEIEEIINLKKKGKIDNREIDKLLVKMFGGSIQKELKNISSKQLLSDEKIIEIIKKIVEINNEMITRDKDRPERIEKFIMGQLMKETKGKASPQVANKLVKDILWTK